MFSNEYQKVVNVLRTREVQPSMEVIRNVVLQERPQKKIIPIWLYFSVGIPALITLSIFLPPQFLRTPQGTSGKQEVQQSSDHVQNLADASVNQSAPIYAGRKNHQIPLAKTIEAQINSFTLEGSTIANEKKPETQEKKTITVEKKGIDKSSETSEMPVKPVVEFTEHPVSDNKFSFFFSGGLPGANSTVSFTNRISASVGIRYNLTPTSSLIFEVRRNVSIQKYSVSKTSSYDTIMLKNGVLVNDTITVTSTSLVESANPFFTLGGGFRYSFVSEGRLIPYGEIILAGSTAYAVTSEVLGIKYGFDPIAIELGIREEQLFSPSSAPQHLFNVNVGMNYTW